MKNCFGSSSRRRRREAERREKWCGRGDRDSTWPRLARFGVALDAEEIEDGGRNVDVGGERGDVFGVVEGARRVDHQGDVEGGFVDGAAAEIGIFANVAAAVIAEDDDDGVVELAMMLKRSSSSPSQASSRATRRGRDAGSFVPSLPSAGKGSGRPGENTRRRIFGARCSIDRNSGFEFMERGHVGGDAMGGPVGMRRP